MALMLLTKWEAIFCLASCYIFINIYISSKLVSSTCSSVSSSLAPLNRSFQSYCLHASTVSMLRYLIKVLNFACSWSIIYPVKASFLLFKIYVLLLHSITFSSASDLSCSSFGNTSLIWETLVFKKVISFSFVARFSLSWLFLAFNFSILALRVIFLLILMS